MSQRRKHFLNEANRRAFTFEPYSVVYGFDWFSPYVDWNTFELAMGLRINARRYLNGQPVRFRLRSRSEPTLVYFVIELSLT